MPDTLKTIVNQNGSVHQIMNHSVNWNLLTLIVATLSLIAAALLPYLQKRSLERKATINFTAYLRMKLNTYLVIIKKFKIDNNETLLDAYYRAWDSFNTIMKKISKHYSVFLDEYSLDNYNELFSKQEQAEFILDIQLIWKLVSKSNQEIKKLKPEKLIEKVLANGEKLSMKHNIGIYKKLNILQVASVEAEAVGLFIGANVIRLDLGPSYIIRQEIAKGFETTLYRPTNLSSEFNKHIQYHSSIVKILEACRIIINTSDFFNQFDERLAKITKPKKNKS